MGNTFGERLKELRTMQGKSQRDIATTIDVNPGIVSQWENGKCVLRDKAKAHMLATYLGTHYDYLMFGKVTETPVKVVDESDDIIEKIGNLPESKATHTLDECKKIKPLVYRAEDGRKLDDINLIIRHLRDMHISKEEKVRLHKRLSQMRTEVESVVLFGEE